MLSTQTHLFDDHQDSSSIHCPSVPRTLATLNLKLGRTLRPATNLSGSSSAPLARVAPLTPSGAASPDPGTARPLGPQPRVDHAPERPRLEDGLLARLGPLRVRVRQGEGVDRPSPVWPEVRRGRPEGVHSRPRGRTSLAYPPPPRPQAGGEPDLGAQPGPRSRRLKTGGRGLGCEGGDFRPDSEADTGRGSEVVGAPGRGAAGDDETREGECEGPDRGRGGGRRRSPGRRKTEGRERSWGRRKEEGQGRTGRQRSGT